MFLSDNNILSQAQGEFCENLPNVVKTMILQTKRDSFRVISANQQCDRAGASGIGTRKR
jgi:hypothetical protein